MRITAQSLGLELANALATLVISETPPLACPTCSLSPPYTRSFPCLPVSVPVWRIHTLFEVQIWADRRMIGGFDISLE